MSARRCSKCGCSEDARCQLGGGDECAWFDAARTYCTKPDCITAYFDAVKAWQEKHRRRTPQEITELQRQSKNRKQREYRARVKKRKALQQQIQKVKRP